MSAFHNAGEVDNQIGRQNVYGDIHHYHTDDTSWTKRRKFGNDDSTEIEALDNEILASLAFPEMFYRRGDIKVPHRSTCQWIFGLKKYKDWLSESSGLLWIMGNPGAGKSTLMAHLYRATRQNSSTDSAVHLDFFFTARGTQLQRTPIGMLRSLLNQIFRSGLSIRDILRKSYREKQESFGDNKRVWEWQRPELENLLNEMVLTLAQHQPLVLFIDALDEAGDESAREMAEYFHELSFQLQQQLSKAKIYISCRHYPVTPKFRALEISVEKHNHEDIQKYIRDRLNVKELLSDDDYLNPEWQSLVQGLIDSARGIFQWVYLVVPMVVKLILKGDKPKSIIRWLAKVPKELGQIYKQIVDQLMREDHQIQSRRLFQWVCLATRPLSVTEMRYAIASHDIMSGSPPADCCDTEDFVGSDKAMIPCIRSWSGGLIEVLMGDSKDKVVVTSPQLVHPLLLIQPIHQSVNEFFMAEGLEVLARLDTNRLVTISQSSSEPAILRTIVGSHDELYNCCLAYMARDASECSSIVCENSGDQSNHSIQAAQIEMEARFPLLRYASLNCLTHAIEARDYKGRDLAKEVSLLTVKTGFPLDQREEANKSIYHIFTLTTVIPSWAYAASIFRSSQEWLLRDTTPLHFAAAAGLTDLARFLLDDGVDVNVVDAQGQSALHVATRRGQLSSVKTLIEYNASIQKITNDGATPLFLAACQGETDIFSWLLNQGADIEAGAMSTESVLNAASFWGHTAIVRLCIRAGANVNAQKGAGSALIIACFEGHEEIAEMLLAAGADPGFQRGPFGTALQAASYNYHEQIVKTLLDAGADINAQGGEEDNALNITSFWGYYQIMRMLLDAGPDVNTKGENYESILEAASYLGYDEIMRILLEAGAAVNSQGEYNEGTIQPTFWEGYEDVVKELLEVEEDDWSMIRGNALQAASFRGNYEIVEMLLDAGADVNAKGGEYHTALQAASAEGHGEIVEILLKKGADVNAQGGTYWNALTAANYAGHWEVEKILIAAGAVPVEDDPEEKEKFHVDTVFDELD